MVKFLLTIYRLGLRSGFETFLNIAAFLAENGKLKYQRGNVLAFFFGGFDLFPDEMNFGVGIESQQNGETVPRQITQKIHIFSILKRFGVQYQSCQVVTLVFIPFFIEQFASFGQRALFQIGQQFFSNGMQDRVPEVGSFYPTGDRGLQAFLAGQNDFK